jgi:hypothetical protein
VGVSAIQEIFLRGPELFGQKPDPKLTGPEEKLNWVINKLIKFSGMDSPCGEGGSCITPPDKSTMWSVLIFGGLILFIYKDKIFVYGKASATATSIASGQASAPAAITSGPASASAPSTTVANRAGFPPGPSGGPPGRTFVPRQTSELKPELGGYVKRKVKKSTNKNRKSNKTKQPKRTLNKNKKSKRNSSQKKNKNNKANTKKHRHTVRHK